MIKIILSVFLLFAFNFSANAQSSLKITETQTQTSKSKNLAYKNAKELSSFLNLSPETSKNFVELFITRDEALTNAKTEEEHQTNRRTEFKVLEIE